MGIQINGTTDTISATDGGLVVSGQQLTDVTGLTVTGVVTATSLSVGGQTISSLGVGIRTAGGTVGTGVTILDLRGAGISTVTVASGIGTINITGGGGGSQLSISTTAPVSPTDGQQWFDSSDGNTYIWYASQNVWVVSQTYGY
jgi:hypothetical protein